MTERLADQRVGWPVIEDTFIESDDRGFDEAPRLAMCREQSFDFAAQ